MDYFFTQTITDICERSLLSVERPLRCIIIVNPVAGGFIIKSKWRNCVNILRKCIDKIQANSKRTIYKSVILNITEGKGSAGEITKDFIERAAKDPIPFYLVISAGGDGNHWEVMNTLYGAPERVRSNMAVLRLPMGTGNDGADSANLEDALDLLINPSHIEFSPAVLLKTAEGGPAFSKGPFLAFNILSLGLDAFVTHNTNIMKGKSPGDTYKLWLDIACLFYGCKYKIDYFDVRAFDDKNNEVLNFKEKLLLLAMGASGHRTYGSQQKILPDDRNFCAVKQMLIFRKLAVKNLAVKGKHTDNSKVIMSNVHRVEFTCKHPILAQMDGETILLQPEDFPAVLELSTPVIPFLKMGQSS